MPPPRTTRIAVAANAVTDIEIGQGFRSMVIIPETTTVELQVAFRGGLANTTGQFIVLTDGQTAAFDNVLNPAESTKISLFATTALNVGLAFFEGRA